MPIEETNSSESTNAAATQDELPAFDKALQYLENLDENKPSKDENKPEQTGKQPAPETKPGKKPESKPESKPEQKPDDAKSKRDAATLLEKATARQAYAERQLTKLETERKSFDDERQAFQTTLKSLTSIDSIVAYLAKTNNRSEDDYWTEFIEHVQNKGKKGNEDSAAMRELKRLRQELADERSAKKKDEDQEKQAQQAATDAKNRSDWQDAVIRMVEDDDGAERWPVLSSTMSPTILRASALMVVENYYDKTGVVATIEQVLDALEEEQASKVKPQTPPAKGETKPAKGAAATEQSVASQARVPSNDDSAAPTTDTRNLSPQEREELAVQRLKSLFSS